MGVGFHCTLLPVEATVVEGDEWGVTTGHVLLHCPDDSVESPVATLWFIHTMAAKTESVNHQSYVKRTPRFTDEVGE